LTIFGENHEKMYDCMITFTKRTKKIFPKGLAIQGSLSANKLHTPRAFLLGHGSVREQFDTCLYTNQWLLVSLNYDRIT